MNNSGRSFGNLSTAANIQHPPNRTRPPTIDFSSDENTVPDNIPFNNLSSGERMRVLLDAVSRELNQPPEPVYRAARRT